MSLFFLQNQLFAEFSETNIWQKERRESFACYKNNVRDIKPNNSAIDYILVVFINNNDT